MATKTIHVTLAVTYSYDENSKAAQAFEGTKQVNASADQGVTYSDFVKNCVVCRVVDDVLADTHTIENGVAINNVCEVDSCEVASEMVNPVNHLRDIMETICAYHYKGYHLGVRVHESGAVGISIDLYNFEGDGEPVCDGLTFKYEGMENLQRAFCVIYDPDWEDAPLRVLCFDDKGDGDDYDELPENLPDTVLNAIIQWLETEMVSGN